MLRRWVRTVCLRLFGRALWRSDARRECKYESAEENDGETPSHPLWIAPESSQTVDLKGDDSFALLVCKMLKVQIFHELVIFESHFSTDFSTDSVENSRPILLVSIPTR